MNEGQTNRRAAWSGDRCEIVSDRPISDGRANAAGRRRVVKTRSEGHFALGLKVVGSLALVLLLCAVNVRAAEESTTKTETKTTETKKSTKTTKHAKHHGRRHR